MPDYEVMYHKLFHATETAIQVLIAAQQECEDIYCAEKEAPENKPLAE